MNRTISNNNLNNNSFVSQFNLITEHLKAYTMRSSAIIVISLLAIVSSTGLCMPSGMLEITQNLVLPMSERKENATICRLGNQVKIVRCACYASITGLIPNDKMLRKTCFLIFKKQNIPKFKGSCRRFMKKGEFQADEFEEVLQRIADECTIEPEGTAEPEE